MKKICTSVCVLLLCLAPYAQTTKADQAVPKSLQILTQSTALVDGVIGNNYSATINFIDAGTCWPTATFNQLPLGLKVSSVVYTGLNSFTLTLSGIPIQGWGQPLLLVLSDTCNNTLSQTYSLKIVSGFNLTDTSLQPGTVGLPYNSGMRFNYAGTSTPVASFTGLPSGIIAGNANNYASADTHTSGAYTYKTLPYSVTLSGSPTTAGTYNVTMTLSDTTTSNTYNYQIVVSPAPKSNVIPTPTPVPTPQPTVTTPTTDTTSQAVAGIDPTGTNISSNGTVYMITADGQKRPYTSAGAFLSYGFNTWATVIPASPTDLALPTSSNFIPPRDGKIICSDRGSDKGTCYLITNSKKAAFTSAAVFKGLGFSFSNTLRGDVSFLQSAANINSASQTHPAGVLVNKGGTIYLVGDSGLLGVPDMATLTSWGYSLADSVKANAADSAMTQADVMSTHTAGALSPFGN